MTERHSARVLETYYEPNHLSDNSYASTVCSKISSDQNKLQLLLIFISISIVVVLLISILSTPAADDDETTTTESVMISSEPLRESTTSGYHQENSIEDLHDATYPDVEDIVEDVTSYEDSLEDDYNDYESVFQCMCIPESQSEEDEPTKPRLLKFNNQLQVWVDENRRSVLDPTNPTAINYQRICGCSLPRPNND